LSEEFDWEAKLLGEDNPFGAKTQSTATHTFISLDCSCVWFVVTGFLYYIVIKNPWNDIMRWLRSNIFMKAFRAFLEATLNLSAAVVSVIAHAEDIPEDSRRLQDSDAFGEMNYRTGRLDSGTDPFGWYDEE